MGPRRLFVETKFPLEIEISGSVVAFLEDSVSGNSTLPPTFSADSAVLAVVVRASNGLDEW